MGITSQYLHCGCHFKSPGSIWTKFCIGKLHSHLATYHLCNFENDPINTSGTSLYIPIVNGHQATKTSSQITSLSGWGDKNKHYPSNTKEN